jgi:hypothetical protein
MRTRRWLAAVAATGALVGLSGCGGGDEPVDKGTPGAAAASSQSVQTEESAPSASPEAQPGGYDAQQLLAAMKAAVADHESVHLTMQGGGAQGVHGEGDVSYAGDSTAMQMEVTLPTGKALVRLVDGVMYMAMPGMTPQGKFLKIDTRNPNSPFGDLGGVLQGDPLATFDAFDAGLEKATYVGAEEVDGEQLDHYVLTVDAKKAAEAQGSPAPSGVGTISYDLWIDSHDLMRRLQHGSGANAMTLTMSDWGEPVTVKAPPASAIMELPGSRG